MSSGVPHGGAAGGDRKTSVVQQPSGIQDEGDRATGDRLNVVEKIKSLRNHRSYRRLNDRDYGADHPEENANDFVLRIDGSEARIGRPNLKKAHTTIDRRGRPGFGNMGSKSEEGVQLPRVRFAEDEATSDQDPGRKVERPGIWRECSYDFSADTNDNPWGQALRAKSFDVRSANLRQPADDATGSLLRKQMKEGSLDTDLENVSLSAMPQWPLKQHIPGLTEAQLFSHSDTSEVSKDSSAINFSGRPSQIDAVDSTNSSLEPTSLLTRVSSTADHLKDFTHPATKHGVPGVEGIGVYGSEGDRFETDGARFTDSRFGRSEIRGDRIDRVDEMSSLRSRRSSSRSSRRFSFVGEELISKSPRAASNYNRVNSRFAEPAEPEESGFIMGGEFVPRSGQLRSGHLKSQQLKSGMIPRTGLLGRVDEEDDDPFKDADLPDRPKYQKNWSYWVFLEWIALLLNLAALTCSRTVPWLKTISLLGLALWKWILLLLVVFCGRLVSGWVVRLFVYCLERNFLMRKKVLYFVYALRRGVKYCMWLGLVLMAWNFMFDARVESANTKLVYITKVLECFLIAAILFVVKVFLVKVLASCFHVGTYFERIRDSLFSQYVLETLSGPPVVEIEQMLDDEQKLMEEVALLRKAGATAPGLVGLGDPMASRSGKLKAQNTLSRSKSLASGEIKPGSGISVQHLHKLNQKNVSAWNMKRLINMVKFHGVTTITQGIHDGVNVDGEEIDTEIRSEWQAKAAAKEIFKNVARPGVKHLDEDDLMRFMQEEEAIRALALFDGAMETGKITRRALKDWVVNVYRERRALALSLSDTKTAVKKLHRILDGVLLIIILIIWVLVLGIATSQLLVLVSSQLLLIVFIFGNTCKTIFEAIIFLFVMHPFDIGDRCVIDGVQYVVEEMNILTTVFLGDANAKVCFPNSVLATKPIQNFYRSPDMGDNFDFVVSADTPAAKIASFKEKIGTYITSKPQHWQTSFGLVVLDIAEGGRLQLSLGLTHTMNHQDFGEKVERRSDLLWEVKRLFEELQMEYRLPSQEVHVKTLPGTTISTGSSI